MDAHVSLEALERFKQLLKRFSTEMSIEAQKMQLHLTKTHQQLEQKHFELKRKLQMCTDQISYEHAKQELIEFERLFAAFCQAAQECIKGFQQQELMAANRQKAVTTIDQKVGVLKEYLGRNASDEIESYFLQLEVKSKNKSKAVNLPSYKKVVIDMEHIMSGHIKVGGRAKQSGIKDLFPENMSKKQIENAIRDAYKNCKRIKTQGDRVKVQGTSDGIKIEMWVNIKMKMIETAYPKY